MRPLNCSGPIPRCAASWAAETGRTGLSQTGPAGTTAIGWRGPENQADPGGSSRRDTGKTLYLLDEPTTGLHFDDVSKLLKVLERLVEMGNTVIIIEHNLEVIKYCDYIIDLGPEGGQAGGEVVAAGRPEEVARVEKSHTGRYLRQVLFSGVHSGLRG